MNKAAVLATLIVLVSLVSSEPRIYSDGNQTGMNYLTAVRYSGLLAFNNLTDFPTMSCGVNQFLGDFNATNATCKSIIQSDINANSTTYAFGTNSAADLNVNRSDYWDGYDTPTNLNVNSSVYANETVYCFGTSLASDLNVNSSNYWDGMDSPTGDIICSGGASCSGSNRLPGSDVTITVAPQPNICWENLTCGISPMLKVDAFNITTQCSDGQVLKNQTGAWVCAGDLNDYAPEWTQIGGVITSNASISSGNVNISGNLSITTGEYTSIKSSETLQDLSAVLPFNLTYPILYGNSYNTNSSIVPFPYALATYDKFLIIDKSNANTSSLMFQKEQIIDSSAEIIADLNGEFFTVNWNWNPEEEDVYDLGVPIRWRNANFSGNVTAGGVYDGGNRVLSTAGYGISVDETIVNVDNGTMVSHANASDTYATIANVTVTYTTNSNATATYVSHANATSTYTTNLNASAAYPSYANVSGTYVPYVGATKVVDLGPNNLTANNVNATILRFGAHGCVRDFNSTDSVIEQTCGV